MYICYHHSYPSVRCARTILTTLYCPGLEHIRTLRQIMILLTDFENYYLHQPVHFSPVPTCHISHDYSVHCRVMDEGNNRFQQQSSLDLF